MIKKVQKTSLERYYKGDAYRTPTETRRSLGDILSFGCRWSFYSDYFSVILRMWFKAKIKKMTYDNYISLSHHILTHVERHRGILNVDGLDHILSSEQNYVIIANHTSSLEAQVLPSLLSTRKVGFVLKKSLLTTPVYGPIMRHSNPVPVTRKNPIEDFKTIMEKGGELLDQGYSIIIFPQGTRTSEFNRKAFNKMGVRLALKGGVPCIPLALKTDFWGNGKIMKTFGPLYPEKEVHFSFGEPIIPTGKGKVAHDKVVSYIATKLKEWDFPVVEE